MKAESHDDYKPNSTRRYLLFSRAPMRIPPTHRYRIVSMEELESLVKNLNGRVEVDSWRSEVVMFRLFNLNCHMPYHYKEPELGLLDVGIVIESINIGSTPFGFTTSHLSLEQIRERVVFKVLEPRIC